jgi:hypothetical protein
MPQPRLQPFAALTIRDGTLALAGTSPRLPRAATALHRQAGIAQFRSIDTEAATTC